MEVSSIYKELTNEDGRFHHNSLKSIATRANCSTQTVTNVLRQRKVYISDQTKALVLEAAIDLIQART